MTITPKERATLRSMANRLESILQLGKGELTPAILKQLDDALTARELVKGSVLETSPYTAREAAALLAEAADAAIVQVIGRRFVLYRPNPKAPVIKL